MNQRSTDPSPAAPTAPATHPASSAAKHYSHSRLSKLNSHLRGPKTLLRNIRADPLRYKRILKIALSLTFAVAITLPAPLAAVYGQNPFLLGTIAIYLFPVRTIGGQIVHSAIGLVGIFLSIAYVNFAIFLANLIQNDDLVVVHVWRRIFLFCALGVGAFGCGWIRSKYLKSYLGMNFFMVVCMFALIRGIDRSAYQFHHFAYPMVIGCFVSMIVSVILWPEDRGKTIRQDTQKALHEALNIVKACHQGLRLGVPVEIIITKLNAAEVTLSASLHEANYEVSFSRVQPESLTQFHRCLSRLIANARVFNAAMRRQNRIMRRKSATSHRQDPDYLRMDDNSVEFRQEIANVFETAIVLMRSMEKRINDVFDGNVLSPVEHEKFAKMLEEFSSKMSREVHARIIEDYRGMELAAFTDQLNTTLLDILDVCKDMSVAVSIVEPGRWRMILPRKLVRNERDLDVLSKGLGDATSHHRSMWADDDAYALYYESTSKFHRCQIQLAEWLSTIQRSRHLKYGVKFTLVMLILALPAFISRWYLWYENLRCQLAMISAMVAMETTRGMSFRTAGMKLIGAAMGGLSAVVVVVASRNMIGISIVLTFLVGIMIGSFVTNTKWAKTGTVCALAYNLILGVSTVFKAQGPVSAAFARRLVTLPIGLSVALFIHLTVFPYHSRAELVKSLGSSLDWLHHLLFAIEASDEYPALATKFDGLVQKAAARVAHAKALMPATHYEFSLSGHWPYRRFENIVEKMHDVMDLMIGEVSVEPVLAFHLHTARSCEILRTKLLASLCNDLLVISHSLTARLFMPRHSSVSATVLQEYILSLLDDAIELPPNSRTRRNYCDVGRLADLVSEMSLLRDEVDELVTETQCPKNGLLPHLSFVVQKRLGSRPGTPSGGFDSRAPTVYGGDDDDIDEDEEHEDADEDVPPEGSVVRDDSQERTITFADEVEDRTTKRGSGDDMV